MTIDDILRIGIRVPIGAHRFDAGSIKAFARKYDPQPFHLDEEAAARSVFGKLCASGWHTAAVWMKFNVAARQEWSGTAPALEFGPSPGFRKLKWPKPVFAGETVEYSRTSLAHRPLVSRPGWRLLTVRADGIDSTGDQVIEFESAVLFRAS